MTAHQRPTLDPATRLHVAAFAALIDQQLALRGDAGARGLLAQMVDQSLATTDEPGNQITLRLYGITGRAMKPSSARHLLRAWQQAAVDRLAGAQG